MLSGDLVSCFVYCGGFLIIRGGINKDCAKEFALLKVRIVVMLDLLPQSGEFQSGSLIFEAACEIVRINI